MSDMTDWRDDAECQQQDPETFFPLEKNHSGPARSICEQACGVAEECLTYAYLSGEKYGVWGGVNLTGARMTKGQHSAQLKKLQDMQER
jgi:WhiB family redox-sensing transcriptional regulator